jgi:hypothetical protein
MQSPWAEALQQWTDRAVELCDSVLVRIIYAHIMFAHTGFVRIAQDFRSTSPLLTCLHCVCVSSRVQLTGLYLAYSPSELAIRLMLKTGAYT